MNYNFFSGTSNHNFVGTVLVVPFCKTTVRIYYCVHSTAKIYKTSKSLKPFAVLRVLINHYIIIIINRIFYIMTTVFITWATCKHVKMQSTLIFKIFFLKKNRDGDGRHHLT